MQEELSKHFGIGRSTVSNILQKRATSWKGRYNVKQYKWCGEGADVDEKVVNDYRSQIPSIISGKNETEVFNCDETGLLYRVQ